MLPFLEQGTQVRSILDKTFPGMAPKLMEFGESIRQEQDGPTSVRAKPTNGGGYSILPLKRKG